MLVEIYVCFICVTQIEKNGSYNVVDGGPRAGRAMYGLATILTGCKVGPLDLLTIPTKQKEFSRSDVWNNSILQAQYICIYIITRSLRLGECTLLLKMLSQ